MMSARLSVFMVVCLSLLASAVNAQGALDRLASMPDASLLLEKNGRRLISQHADRPMIPASTLKLVTALAALERWGADHHFETDFFYDDKALWVRGRGDPFLVSEELDLIVAALKKRGLKRVNAIFTDASLYANDLRIDGRSNSDNPYDAPLSALAANFNTVNYKTSGNKVVSAESQTPLTPLAKTLAESHANKKRRGRVNLVRQENGPRYFAELLAAKLRLAGIEVGDRIEERQVSPDLTPFYQHRNSRSLSEVVSAMLENSSNFIANNIFLMLAGDKGPLDMSQARAQMRYWIDQRFGWKSYEVMEGSGLSRSNRMTADQLLDVVKAFEPYKALLPDHKGKVLAKTGTLRGVSCYAGFVNRHGEWVPFCLFINQPSEYNFRKQVAETLSDSARLPAICTGKEC